MSEFIDAIFHWIALLQLSRTYAVLTYFSNGLALFQLGTLQDKSFESLIKDSYFVLCNFLIWAAMVLVA